MEDRLPSFGDLLRHARLAAGLSQEALAKRAGLSVRGVSDLERGARRRPHPTTLHRLADAFGLSPPERAAWSAAARGELAPDASWPRPLTSFVGRAAEIDAIAAIVRRPVTRLVTLTGPGGVGKTRLVHKVAEASAGSFPDGAWFVALAPVRDASLVAATVAETLGVRASRSQTVESAVQAFLAPRRALLVLDNFEHVLEAIPLLADWLTTCPELTVIVTSRAVLRLSGEHIFDVAPLSLAPTGNGTTAEDLVSSEAIQLFVDRATATRRGVVSGPDDLAAIAAICEQLDGLPLAIELAAARVRSLPIDILLALLERRLELLTEGPRDQPARLRSMRDAIAWSYDLLSPGEQCLFRGLSVFVGGFDLDGAAAVADGDTSVLSRMTALVDTSLVRPISPGGGEYDAGPRFTMLETIREFGLEQLAICGEEDRARQRHADHFFDVIEAITPTPRWPPSAARTSLIRTERDNLRGSLAWLERTGDIERNLLLATRLFPLWYSLGNVDEGYRCLVGGLTRGDALPTPLRALALSHAGALLRMLGDHERALQMAREALALAETIEHPSLDDRFDAALMLRIIGDTLMERGHFAEAEAYLERSLGAFRALGSDANAAYSMSHLGMCAYGRGNLDRALACCSDALEVARTSGTTWVIAKALTYVGIINCLRGDMGAAASALDKAFVVGQGNEDMVGMSARLVGAANVAAGSGAPEAAARLLGAAEAQTLSIGLPMRPPMLAFYERTRDAACTALGVARFAADRDEGEALTASEAEAEARSILATLESKLVATEAAMDLAEHGLTPRELEVLRLVSDGRTNREIAEALYISIPTVKRHLSTIYGKLGVASRADASACTRRHGLV